MENGLEIMMNTAAAASTPIKRSLSVTALLVAGAAGGIAGVAGVKYLAPHWLNPGSATASSSVTSTQPVSVIPAGVAKPVATTHAGVSISPTTRPTASASAKPATTAKPAPLSPQEIEARQHGLVSQLQLCRSQLELYKLQHHDKLPEFSKHLWAQLTQATRPDGTPDAKGSCGPYLAGLPVNPLNNYSSLGLVKKDPAPAQVMHGEKLGYIFCAATGHLFATAADGKTIFDESAYAETAPKENKPIALKSQLLELRSSIELYKLQHVDLPPEFARSAMWEQLTRRTRSNGAFDLRGFGPYLPRRPVNALNGFSKVECVATLTPNYKPKDQQVGYVFETSSGRLYATDEHGAIFKE